MLFFDTCRATRGVGDQIIQGINYEVPRFQVPWIIRLVSLHGS